MRGVFRYTSTLFIASYLLIPSSFLFNSCSSNNNVVSSKLELNLPEQKSLLSKVKRSEINYISNLKDYSPSTEIQLIEEAKFQDIKLYNESARVLTDWILRALPSKVRIQVAKNCENLIAGFKNQFPLNEETLTCAAWWLEKRNNEAIANASKLSPGSPPIIKFLSSKQRADWKNFEGLSFNDAFYQLDPLNVSKAKKISADALEVASDCDYSNANAALIIRLEPFLPDKEIYSYIDKIYNKMKKCLSANIEPSEKLHLRVGLLRLISGQPEIAKESLELALLDKDPGESSRSLFWLGTIHHKSKNNLKENPYWQRLLKENSISLAAIVASQQLGIDPLDNLVPDKDIELQSRESNVWNENNLEAFVFDLLRAKKQMTAAKEWANFVGRTSTVTNPKLILYWILAQNNMQNYRYSIFMLGRYSKYYKNFPVSKKLLTLHFPKPYLREIANHSKEIDPIFVLSLVRQESAFDTHAQSSANARGLMQVLPTTAKTIKRKTSPRHLFDPDKNLEIGSKYLNILLRKYNGKTEYALAAYNAGASNVDKWRERVSNDNIMLFCDYMPFKETRSYVSLILRNYYWYTRIISEKDDVLSKKVIAQSVNAKWKSERVKALVNHASNADIKMRQKELLDKIFIFGKSSSNISINQYENKNSNNLNNIPNKNNNYKDKRVKAISLEKEIK